MFTLITSYGKTISRIFRPDSDTLTFLSPSPERNFDE